jgi:glucosamine kinase
MTPLAKEILHRFGNKPEHMVAFARGATSAEYAAFAPSVFDHAKRADPLAIDIVKNAAEQAGMMIRHLSEVEMPAISVVGGLAAVLIDWLPEDIRARLSTPRHDALDGAIMMVRQDHGRRRRSDAVEAQRTVSQKSAGA